MVRSLQRRQRALWFLFALMLFVLLVLVGLAVLPGNSGPNSSTPITDSGTTPETQVVPDPPPMPSEDSVEANTAEDQAAPEGTLSGAWSMWWTNSLGDQSVAFTLRFNGDTSGTVEVLNDNTEYDTFFELDDEVVWLGFTRVLDPGGPASSFFIGTFAEDGIVYGEWTRLGDGQDDPDVWESWLVRDT